jgi:hypothetical protein
MRVIEGIRSDPKFVDEILARNIGAKFWREILARNFGAKFWREILARNFGAKSGKRSRY